MHFKRVLHFAGLAFVISMLIWFVVTLWADLTTPTDMPSSIGWPLVYRMQDAFETGAYVSYYNMRYFIADYLIWTAVGFAAAWLILKRVYK